MLRVGALSSGRGSNLAALLEWQRRGMLAAEVVQVVCNHAGAPVIELCWASGVPVEVIEYPRTDADARRRAQARTTKLFERAGVGLVVLAGYDRILVPEFVRRWEARIINVHPSLLPAYRGGLRAQAEAVVGGARVSGCTVHFVTEDVDGGPIIAQAAVPVYPDDTAETLSGRILEQEHRLLPAAVRSVGLGRVRLEGNRVMYTEGGQ